MKKSFIEIVIGDLEQKRAYHKCMKRVRELPKDYRFAFKKMQHYMYNFDMESCSIIMFTDLVELFENSVAEGKNIVDVIGSDVASFCEELILASIPNAATTGEKLNQEILEYFKRGGK